MLTEQNLSESKETSKPLGTTFERLVFRIELLAALAFQKWGKQAQMVKAIEEFSELNVCLAKCVNKNPHLTAEQLIDEIADATIMVVQLRLMTNETAVDERIQYKLDRLAKALAVST
jgi:hypothetical protein